MGLFSVCTAFFNDPVSNAEALYASLLAQDAEWEWVVADDFSEDDSTREWLQDLSSRDRRVRYVLQSSKMEFMRNPAPFADGDYVFHIDSDDLVFPGYLSLCERHFDRFPEVGVILCASVYEDQHGSFQMFQQHAFEGAINFLGRCWRRSLGPDLGFMPEGFFTYCNDMFIVRALSVSSQTLVIPRVFVRYMQFKTESTGGYVPFGSRMPKSEGHEAAALKSYWDFMDWYSPREQKREGIFPLYHGISELAMALWPMFLFGASGSVSMVGFGHVPEWQRQLLEEAYFGFCFHWGDRQEGSVAVFAPGARIEDVPGISFFPGGHGFEQAAGELGPCAAYFHGESRWLVRR